MRAVVMRAGEFFLEDIPEPRPGPGQLLVEPIAVGICGSDLSAWQHTADYLRAHRAAGAEGGIFDPGRGVVFGHEFTSRVLEAGPDAEGYAAGDQLVTLPWVVDRAGVVRTVGYSEEYPGGLAERVVVQAGGHLKIPDGVDARLAAVTEPLATGVNGVLRSRITEKSGAVVTGCGPVGLGAVIELAYRGVGPIVASDPSPARRAIAAAFGADAVVDPTAGDPVETWRELALNARDLYVFEASGAQGILHALLSTVPAYTSIYVTGASMVSETVQPVLGVLKNVTISFVGGPGREETSYTALARAFGHLAAGRFDPAALVTGYAGLPAIRDVFDALRPYDPQAIRHVKILIRHDLQTAGIVTPQQAG